MIRNDNGIRGIRVHKLECKVSQFADDMTCFVSKFSGLRLNWEKSAIIPVGQVETISASVEGIPVVPLTKILGVWFSREGGEEEHYTQNFAPELDNMRQICSSWSNRSVN